MFTTVNFIIFCVTQLHPLLAAVGLSIHLRTRQMRHNFVHRKTITRS